MKPFAIVDEVDLSVLTDEGEWVPVQGITGVTMTPAAETAAEALDALGQAWARGIAAMTSLDESVRDADARVQRRRPEGKFPSNPQGFVRRGKRR